MSPTPSAQYSLTIRVEIEDRPGMLGKVASAIGDADGTIGAIDLVEVGERLVRDITVDAHDANHWEQILEAIPPELGAGGERGRGDEDRRRGPARAQDGNGGLEVVGVAVVEGDGDAAAGGGVEDVGQRDEVGDAGQCVELLGEALRVDGEVLRVAVEGGDAVVDEHQRAHAGRRTRARDSTGKSSSVSVSTRSGFTRSSCRVASRAAAAVERGRSARKRSTTSAS